MKKIKTLLVVRHFPDRKKACLCLEQGNKGIIIATFRNEESERLYDAFVGGCSLCKQMDNMEDKNK